MNASKKKTSEEVAEAYDSPPWWYDIRGFFILTFAYNSTLGTQLRLFGPNFGPRHLEVACGTGTLLEMALKWRKRRGLPEVEVIGIDYAESMLAGARKRFAGNRQVKIRHADAAALPFPDNSFDTVNIANSVHCFPDVEAALREVRRVLKPGGTVAMNVLLYPRTFPPLRWIAGRINDWGIRKGILHTPYTAGEVRTLLQSAALERGREWTRGNCLNLTAFASEEPIAPR